MVARLPSSSSPSRVSKVTKERSKRYWEGSDVAKAEDNSEIKLVLVLDQRIICQRTLEGAFSEHCLTL